MRWIKNIFSKKTSDVAMLLSEVVSIYPDSCASPNSRIEYLYEIQEKLLQLRKTFMTWRDEGISENTWAGLPEPIRKAYLYKFQIDAQTWQRFHNDMFTPRFEKIADEICIQRAAFKKGAVRDIFNASGKINIGDKK